MKYTQAVCLHNTTPQHRQYNIYDIIILREKLSDDFQCHLLEEKLNTKRYKHIPDTRPYDQLHPYREKILETKHQH